MSRHPWIDLLELVSHIMIEPQPQYKRTEKNITSQVTLLEKRKLDERDRKEIPEEIRQPIRREKNASTRKSKRAALPPSES